MPTFLVLFIESEAVLVSGGADTSFFRNADGPPVDLQVEVYYD